ncbi:Rieske 2Fe-2S domain-containing protein [Croceicoccus sp. YJ47]|uniref:aromatic ring-hydroxylating oxygenase subunit alpha n=1 Tax=Croceicoccus sp. YJ47 TaxID=2798724 RepID=UPI001921A056|nr:Rieske 2Fe-2S domain-containing protein [Croceicoccus sp. YJ47]QQN75321.1 Rieske 2Fe-2S domain-containing protein [Croceicoccus sp. YJ47]
MNLVHIDREKGRFLVDKRAFMDPAVFERERELVFSRSWLYLGHESEIEKPGDFHVRMVGGYSMLFNRDVDGEVNAFHNLCTHRGVMLQADTCGKAKTFSCPYHGWVFRNNGTLLNHGPTGGYSKTFNDDGAYNLKGAARLEQYRGFWFVNMNPRAIPLYDYLAGAREWIDLIVDQFDAGLEVLPGTQQFQVNCNWKSITENQIDSYHGPSLHVSYFMYAAERAGASASPGQMKDRVLTLNGQGVGLGNGHAGVENHVKVGKPWTDWIPAFGEEVRPVIEANAARIVARHGEERGKRMNELTRQMLIFPNTLLNDILSLSVRTSYPTSPASSRSMIWNLAPKGEDARLRRIRLQNHLTFVGPGGFAHPDDYEIFDRRALADAASPQFMHDYSKGMQPDEDGDILTGVGDQADEAQQRAWWAQWDRVVRGEETFEE